MKRLPEKAMMAALILSCGFVMQADPPAQYEKAKSATDARNRRMIESAAGSTHDVAARIPASRNGRIAR